MEHADRDISQLSDAHLNTTVADLMELVKRQKQLLSEGGRPDLAERCKLLLHEDGQMSLTFPAPKRRASRRSAPEVVKALSLDPKFEEVT